MKKITILLAVAMLVSVMAAGVYADEMPALYTKAAKIDNNKVELALSISEGSNIAGCSFNVVYDSDKLTYESHEVGSVISTLFNFVNPQYNANAIRVLWADTSELTVGGQIIKIVFKINDGASGKTNIMIDKLKMADIYSNTVECLCENAVIHLTDEVEDDNIDYSDEFNKGGEASSESTGTKPQTTVTTGNVGTTGAKEEATTVEETQQATLLSFNDVNESDWFYENVRYVLENKLMNGISENEFAPNNTLTRAMLVTILYRNAGEPVANENISFSDVGEDSWYANAVVWAKNNGIANGVNDNEFAPDNNITREQIAAIMYRYAIYMNYDVSAGENTNILSYNDAADISEYAIASVQYVVGSGLIKGKSATTLNPLDNATRAEIAAILQRFITNNK